MKLPRLWTRREPSPGGRTPRRRTAQLVYLAAVIVVALAFAYATFVIYQLVDRTLSASEVVIRLRTEVAPEPFRASDVQQATAHAEAKRGITEPVSWNEVANPFREGRAPPAAR